VMLGPAFLHYKADYKTYRFFTDWLESKLNSPVECLEISGVPLIGMCLLKCRYTEVEQSET
jgi:hypothetical protein